MGYLKVSEKPSSRKIFKFMNNSQLFKMGVSIDVRPRGSIGDLFDKVSAKSDDPLSDIEKIAQQALNDNSINEGLYFVLQHRLPFSGYERKPLHEVGRMLNGISVERVRQKERQLFRELIEYLPKEKEEEIGVNSDIGKLPWKKLYGAFGIRVYWSLRRKLWSNGKDSSVGNVLELFNKAADEGYIPYIRRYGPKSLEATYAVFNEINVKLPKV